MTPKEKAQELVDWFLEQGLSSFGRYQSSEIEDMKGAIFCSIKVVDEILKNSVNYNAYDGVTNNDIWADDNYWEEVKQEIKKVITKK